MNGPLLPFRLLLDWVAARRAYRHADPFTGDVPAALHEVLAEMRAACRPRAPRRPTLPDQEPKS